MLQQLGRTEAGAVLKIWPPVFSLVRGSTHPADPRLYSIFQPASLSADPMASLLPSKGREEQKAQKLPCGPNSHAGQPLLSSLTQSRRYFNQHVEVPVSRHKGLLGR